MLDIEHLESEWRYYRRGKSLKLLLLLFLILFVFACTVVVWQYFSISSVDHLKPTLATRHKNKDYIKQKNPHYKEKVSTKRQILQEPKEKPPVKQNFSEKAGKIIFQEDTIEENNKKDSIKRKKLDFKIVSRSKSNMVNDIEGRFEYSKEKNDALFLAKYYYDKHKYKKSRKWALEANKLDSKSEDSWLIFAKTQAKLGKRVEALKILDAFMKQGGSKKVKILIGKIRHGKGF